MQVPSNLVSQACFIEGNPNLFNPLPMQLFRAVDLPLFETPSRLGIVSQFARTLNRVVQDINHLFHCFQSILDVEAVRMSRISIL